jgi:integrase/recombinase XerC
MGLYFEEFSAFIQFEKRFSRHTLLAYENDLRQFFSFLEHECPDAKISGINHVAIRAWMVLLVEQ